MEKGIKRRFGVLAIIGLLMVVGISASLSAQTWGSDHTSNTSYRIIIDSDGNEDNEVFAVWHDGDENGIPPGTELFRVQEDGKVGIGTASPGELLSLEGTKPDISFKNTGTNFKGRIGQYHSDAMYMTSNLYHDGSNWMREWTSRGGVVLELAADKATFLTATSGSNPASLTLQMRILNTGNVGIGVTNPAEKLEIDGNVLFNYGSARTIYVEKPSGDINGYDLTVRAGHASYDSAGLDGYDGGNLYLFAGDGEGGVPADGGDVYICGGAPDWSNQRGDVILAHTGSTTLGNVGIGTATPNEKLEVDGKIRANTCFNVAGTDGITQVVTFEDNNGGTHILTFTGGILTGYTPP